MAEKKGRTLKTEPGKDEAQAACSHERVHALIGADDGAVWSITTNGVTVRHTKRNPADQINGIIRLALQVAATRAASDAKQGVRSLVAAWIDQGDADEADIDQMVELLFLDFAAAVESMLTPRSDIPAGTVSEGDPK